MTVALTGTPVLQTARLILHAPVAEDFDAYADFMASPRAAFVGGPMVRATAWRYFGHHVGHWALRGFGTFFLKPRSGGPAVGMIMAWHPEGYPEREVGWCIFTRAAAGQGYAIEGARAVLDHVFGTLGWTTAVSYIAPENTASIKLAARLGAVHDRAAPQADPALPDMIWRHSPGGMP
ncbi:MAG: GNAT family N-acetyltransferase [Tabrizicola sp.]|nr:GNAT family N-acetyltransferase [Tabrizicola sp.]